MCVQLSPSGQDITTNRERREMMDLLVELNHVVGVTTHCLSIIRARKPAQGSGRGETGNNDTGMMTPCQISRACGLVSPSCEASEAITMPI